MLADGGGVGGTNCPCCANAGEAARTVANAITDAITARVRHLLIALIEVASPLRGLYNVSLIFLFALSRIKRRACAHFGIRRAKAAVSHTGLQKGRPRP